MLLRVNFFAGGKGGDGDYFYLKSFPAFQTRLLAVRPPKLKPCMAVYHVAVRANHMVLLLEAQSARFTR